MNNFTFYSPTCFVFGKDTESQAGALVRRFGGRAVVVYVVGRCARFVRGESALHPDVLRPGRAGRLFQKGGHFGGIGVGSVHDKVTGLHEGAHLLRTFAPGEDGDAVHLRLLFPTVVGRHADRDVVSPFRQCLGQDAAFGRAAKQQDLHAFPPVRS